MINAFALFQYIRRFDLLQSIEPACISCDRKPLNRKSNEQRGIN